LSSALKGSEWSAACPTTFPLQKELLAPTTQEAPCSPELVRMLFGRKTSFATARNRTTIPQVSSLWSCHYTDNAPSSDSL